MSDKKFGLVIPKKADKVKVMPKSVFGDDSDDDDEKKYKRPKIPQKKVDVKRKVKQESPEDPSIYEYDNIYDEMKAKEAQSIAPKEKKNSRYIETLLKAADKRKKEYERRVDKKIQAEREKEGDLYKDKEAFVTSSYKKKLQEKEEEEERERRENILNDMMDITRQKDLSGFYRHFLKQTVGEEKIPVFGEKYVKQEALSGEEDHSENVIENVKDNKNIDQDSDGIEIDSDSESKDSGTSEEITSKKSSVIQNTTHRYSVSEEEGQQSKVIKHVMSDEVKHMQKKKKSKTYNKKTSNFSDSSSESSVNDEDITYSKKSFHSDKQVKSGKNTHNYRHHSLSSDDYEVSKKSDEKEQDNCIKKENIKTNIYAKRTVGDIFIEAQARYFQRMALKK